MALSLETSSIVELQGQCPQNTTCYYRTPNAFEGPDCAYQSGIELYFLQVIA